MASISREQYDGLVAAIYSHDFLRQVVEAIEHHHRLVFHANEAVDWRRARESSEQILIAEIVSRHRGNIDGIYFALRASESAGRPWGAAIHELAGRIHSYFTTPLGVIMRRDLFGDRAVFIVPDADELIRGGAARPGGSAEVRE